MQTSLGRRALASLLAILVVASAVGCGVSDPLAKPQQGSRRLDPPPETSQGTGGLAVDSGTARLRSGVMSTVELHVAYRAILDRFADPVDHRQLVRAAIDGLRGSLREQQVLPMFTMPLDLVAVDQADPEKAWVAFGEAYDATVQKLPTWAEQTHADWETVRRMVATLSDGHSTFLTPDEVRQRNESSFAGIGVSLARSDQGAGPLVAEVFPQSPAAAAGLRRGDRIVGVDGQTLAGRQLTDVVQMIRGPRGSEVRLTVQRTGAARPFEIRLTRAQVRVEPVLGGLAANNSGLGYLRIRTFTDDAADETNQILQLGAQNGVRAWIIDLRGNSGGSLDAVQRIAGTFLGDRVPVGFEVSRDGQQTVLQSSGPSVAGNLPLVVLVDHDTASGSEILTAALREKQAAQVVGAKTAGNVGVAAVLPLPDGSAVQITERRYLTSAGGPLDRVGVQPDVPLETQEADIEAGRDPQLQRASEIVAQKLGRSQP